MTRHETADGTAASREERIAALPAHLREQLRSRLGSRAQDRGAPETIPAAAREDGAPLSPAQERLWYLHEVDPDSIEYNVLHGVRLDGPLDRRALSAALRRLAARHEALRTVFDSCDGVGRQLPRPVADPPLHLHDLTDLPAPERGPALDRLLLDEARTPFDLRRGPLLRTLLVALAPERHALVLSLHHIVTDGWSAGVLTGDLMAYYTAETRGEPAALPELPVQYADYAVWLRERLARPGARRGLGHWRERLDGLQPLDLPTDRPRPAVRSGAGALHPFTVPAPLADRLRALSKERGATVFMTLTAAVELLLSRRSGQTDVAVATAVSGRERPETERMAGFFVNNLVLRTSVDESRPFTALLDSVRSTVLDALEHQDVPYQRVVEELRPERDPSRPALVDVAVNLHNPPGALTTPPELRLSELPTPSVTSSMDLAFDFTERDGELAASLSYNTDLYTPRTARTLATALVRLLERIAAAPNVPLHQVSPLDEDERRRILTEWGDHGDRAASRVATVPELFAEQVAARPFAPAVVSDGETLSYAELDRRADRLARLLAQRGAGPEQLVAVGLPRSVEAVVTVLAVLKCGAAHLPLDLSHPDDRLRLILDDARPSLLVTTQDQVERLAPSAPALALDDPATTAALAAQPEGPPGTAPLAGHPAYAIFTSGSTGRPKGVLVTHQGVHGLVTGLGGAIGAGPGSRVLQFASPGFDAAFYELATALLSGGALVVADRDELLPGDPLAAVLTRHAVTHATLPPSALTAMDPGQLPAGMTLAVAGEACPPETARLWSAGRRMFNAYGPTETTVCATVTGPLDPARLGEGPVPIGHPLPAVRVRLLDRFLRPVPAGVPGEVYLSGAGLARGYLGRPGLTAERFVADPFGAPGARMYRAGDRARWLPDGSVEYLGRTDDQVKLRGFRIEPGEIEDVLARCPGVQAAAVTARQDTRGVRRLVAYVVTGGSGPDTAALRHHARGLLPEYMVPSAFVHLDALPVNANGKIDRRALPDPGREQGPAGVAPRTGTERVIARIWCELLGVDQVGVEENFFDLGGDSILSLQVVSRARDAGVALTARQTFLLQTVAELAAAADAAAPHPGTPALQRGPVSGPLPATPVQRWFFERLDASLDRFNQTMLLELGEQPDEAALRTVLTALTAHHDGLRLRAEPGGDGWRLRIAETEDGPLLTRTDLGGLPAGRREAAVAEAAARIQEGFPLAEGPLLRAHLLTGPGTPARLLLAAHHLVVDVVSWRVLLEDLETGYAQARSGRPVELPARTASFQEWAVRLREHTAAGGFAEEVAYWKAVEAARAQAGRLPVDLEGANTVATERSVTVRLTPKETEALLRQAPAAYRTRANDLLLSAVWRAVADATGHDAVPVALEGHGRADLFADLDLSRTVGWFTTLYPVVLSADAGAGWSTVLKAVKEQLRAVPSHGVGHGALRWLSGPDGPLAGAGEPEISFNYLGRLDTGEAPGGLVRARLDTEGRERAPGQERPYLIEVNGYVADGVLRFDWAYSTARHHPRTVERIARAFAEALREIVRHCAEPGSGGATPSDFPLVRLDQVQVDTVTGGGTVEDVYPLTPAQSGMLFHSLSEPERDMYTGHFGVRLDGVADPRALARAWQRVVDRTPALRTSVVWEDVPEPVQVVHRDVEVPVTQLDWRGLPAAERQEALDRYWDERVGRSLDLTSVPLLRLTVVRLTDTSVEMFWSTHHMMVDGWSFSHVLSDVFQEYAAGTAGRAPAPARPPYRQYVSWLLAQDPAAAERYWRQTLKGFTGATPLPYDRAPVQAHSTRSSRERRVVLPLDRSQRLYETARTHRLTVNTLVQGAWAALLARYSGEDEVCFGATVSGRPTSLPGAEAMIGLFIDTVPVRVPVGDQGPALTWLRRIQEEQAEARDFAYAGLADVQRWSGLGETRLFDSIVVFENYPYDEKGATEQGIRIGTYRSDEHTNYPLTLTAHAGDQLTLALGYDPDLFGETTVERLAGHLDRLLDALVTTPQTPLHLLPMLSDEETAHLLHGSNDTAARFPAPRTVPELFAEQALRTPDRVAVRCGTGELTYAQLDAEANRLAHHLVERGVGPGVLVGVCAGRGTGAVTALLAVGRAGGAFVPLDPSYPEDRLALMLQDAAVQLVVTEEELLPRTAASGAVPVCLDRDRAQWADRPATAPPGGPAVDDLAYVIYTSGTTGRPKGVMVEHRHLHHMVHAWDARYGLSALEPRVLSVSSLSVDLFFADFLLSALFGGTMVICPSETVGDPVALTALLLSSRAELMVTVPTLARAVVQELGWSGVRADHLKVLLVGSEGWPVDSAAEVRAGLGPGTLVANAYGSTETTVDSTAFELLPGRPVDGAHVPIGKPLANTRIYVLDRDRRPVPAGVVGECWIGGDGVSRGYLNRPALTAERFPEDPFAGVPGARMYRTGDLVRRRPDGDLECVGRADDQVKIGGFRVELGEVEAALARHPDIAAAAAVVRPDAAGVGRLVAHLVPRSGRTPDLAAVRAHASALLPAPAVPSALSLLAELPMTPAGTVDRRMLPAPARPLETNTAYEAPQEGAEAVLAEIWAEVLGLERVGRSDNFFALGGDSVMSIRVISRMRALLGVAVSPRQLFDTPTVAGLAQRLDGTASGAPGRGSGPVPTDPEQPAELSSGQQRLWFLHEFAPESSEYHTALALRLRGRPDPDVLRTALTDVAGRHEPLRTVYRTVDGRPTQVVLAPEPVEPVHADLSHLPADAREEAARTYLRDQLEQPIDLGEPPVLRAHLVRLDDDTHLLVLVMHHIATDGWSMDLIAAELGAAYAAAERGEPLLLPALPVRYADYAAWQRTRLEGPEYAGHLAHWRRRLDGTAPLALPVDRPRPAVRSAEGALTMVDLDPAVVDGVRQLARSQDATLFMALVAAVQLLLSRITGQSDIAVATPVSGRGRPELDGLVGFFVNTVVLRTEVDEALSFAGLLDRARTTVLEAFDHAEVPFDRVVEEVRPERDASRNPLAEVSVALESGPGGDLSFGGLAAEPVPLVGSQVSYDLGFEFFEQDGRLTAGISWSTALFDRSTVDRLAERFEALLRGVLTEHRRLTDVPVGPPAAARTAPAGGGPGELPAEGVVARFEREAALRPDAPAVVAAGERLTFGEAEARANRLARLLAARGIGPERLVAVPGHRTAATVVSLLAVLKTGAAYLPYDPEQPAERLAHQFADAEPALLLGPGAGAWAGAVPSLDPAGPALAAELAGLSAAPLTDAVRTAPADPRDPAYVIYTSGSTGRPKGVVVEHRNLARLAEEHLTVRAGRYPGSAPDGRPRAALTATFAFDSSVVGLLVLAGGGELHVVDDLTRRDPEALVRYVRDHRVDHLEITPTFAEQLVAAGLLRPGGHRPGRVVLGGEAVGEALWTRLAEAEGVLGENTYGPTECTVETLYAPVTADAAPHLGRPLTGTRAHLLDRYLRPVEDGTPGELYLAGGQLGRGYLKRPALTAERFCADPSGPPGARMYRTGDRARRRPDGTLEFLGRADHQVKIRGYRVEPGEIEAVLAALPGTGSAVVTVRPGATGAPRLVAHVTALPGHHLAPAGVRDACRAVLPSYMVPSAVAVLNELPLTASGKVDRARLPEPESAEGPEEGYRAPAEGAERVLAEIWAEVLGRERVGADDNFFDLGGDSVLSLQAVHRVRQAGFRLTSRELFLHPTVAGLATVVTPAGKDADQERGPVSGELPLTPMQQEFLDADPVHPHHFTQSVLAELADGADEEALAAALAELPVRHDMLRARFTHDGTRWRQRIDPGPPGEVPLVRHDLSALPEDERWAAVERLAAEADAGHDLAAGRLWSALLLDLGPGRRRQLFLTVHHLVVDAVSWRVLLDDLATGHAQLRAGEPVRLPARTTSFQEWARRLRDHTRAGGFDAELPHWRGLPEPAPLPRDRAGEYRHGEVRTVLAELGEEETELLLHRATGLLRAAPRDLVLAGLARVLARWTGQRAVTVDLEGHGREDLFEEVDLSRTVGWFTTLYPVSLDLPGEEAGSGAPEDWKALARAVRRGLRATPGNGLGHGALRRLAEGGAVPGGPGAEVVFNYHGQTDLPHDPEGLFHAFGPPVGLDRSPAAREGHLLEVVGAVSGGRLRLTWYYAETVHHRATVERLAAEHLGLLRAAARHGEER